MKTGTEAKATRAKLKMTQTPFWNRVGITQSAGSRYETGRGIPEPVQKLLSIAYGKPNVSAKIVKDLRGGK
jgi:DNA-binding transcriptional regulator YiaG